LTKVGFLLVEGRDRLGLQLLRFFFSWSFRMSAFRSLARPLALAALFAATFLLTACVAFYAEACPEGATPEEKAKIHGTRGKDAAPKPDAGTVQGD
jgi:hypothetical protein